MTPQRKHAHESLSVSDFHFTGQRRSFPPVEIVPFRWPSKVSIANEYVEDWQAEAKAALVALRLSSVTLDTIASHISRRDGSITLSDRALSARSGRSLSSTERDVQRLKRLGFLIAEHDAILGRQGRTRVLKPSLPAPVFVPPRIPPESAGFCPSTDGGYVEGVDIGERRDV